MHMVVCVLWQRLVLKRACKGEVAPSLASSLPSHKWAGCTREERGGKKTKQPKSGILY